MSCPPGGADPGRAAGDGGRISSGTCARTANPRGFARSAGRRTPVALPLMVRTAQVREGKQLDLVFTVPSGLEARVPAQEHGVRGGAHRARGQGGRSSPRSKREDWRIASARASARADSRTRRAARCSRPRSSSRTRASPPPDEVISLFFQYAEMMRRTGPQEWSWREAQGLRAIEFRFKEEEGAADYTEMLAMTMRRYAHQDCLRGDYLFDEFAPKTSRRCSLTVVPRSACTSSPTTASTWTRRESSASGGSTSRSARETVDPAKIAAWESCEPDAALAYPPRNEYIAERFDIAGGAGAARAAAPRRRVSTTPPPPPLVTPPEIVHECPAMRLWHRMDDKFDQPRTCAYFLRLAAPPSTPRPRRT